METDRDGSQSAYSHDKYCFPSRHLKLPPEVEAICTPVGRYAAACGGNYLPKPRDNLGSFPPSAHRINPTGWRLAY